MQGTPRLRTALFVGTWLPYSETFVREQIRNQRRLALHVFARGAAIVPPPEGAELTVLSEPESVAWYWLGWAPKFERAFEEYAPALAHAHFGVNGALAAPLARKAGIPLAVSFHGHDVGGLLPQNRYRPRYFRYQRHVAELWEGASLVICASADLADTLVGRCGAPGGKIWVHHLGVDVSRPPPERPPHRFHVLMVGRLVEKKGMSYGLEAFARLLSQVPHARLSIVGGGPLHERLEREARALGVRHAITLHGVLPPEQVRMAMEQADVLLTPSVETPDLDRESGVLVVKEAGAAGLPIVGFRHGGIPEIVRDGDTGLLAHERDVAGLASHLLALAADPVARVRMGARARDEVASRFDVIRQNRILEDRLLGLVAGPALARPRA